MGGITDHMSREKHSPMSSLVLRHRFRSEGRDPFRVVESASHLANPLYIFTGSTGQELQMDPGTHQLSQEPL